ncbi:MAG: hypothetical protein DYG92_12000 [Leptolyngbya sp. PLA1]|nr:hypothetical protein [Leptolyngbya sp. PLA1]
MTDAADDLGMPLLLLESGQPVTNWPGEDWVSLDGLLVTDAPPRAWFDGTSESYVGVGRVECDGSPDDLVPFALYDILIAAQPHWALFQKNDGTLSRLNDGDTASTLVAAGVDEWPEPGSGAINEAGHAVAIVGHSGTETYRTLRFFPQNLSGVADLFDSRGPLPGMSGKYLQTLRWATLDDTDDDFPVIAFEARGGNSEGQTVAHAFSIWANTGEGFEFQCVMKSGDAAPSLPTGSVLGDPWEIGIDRLGLSLNRAGQIAFAAAVTFETAPIGGGVFVVDVFGPSVSCRVATGDQSAGLPPGYEFVAFSRSWIMDNGNLVFEGTAASEATGSSVNGVWMVEPDQDSFPLLLSSGDGSAGDPFFFGTDGCFRAVTQKHIWEQGGRADGRRRAILEDGRTILRVELAPGPIYTFVTTEAAVLGVAHEPDNVFADITCDFNCDGNVDQDDVSALVGAVGGGPSPCCKNPDINDDGNVDGDDVTELMSRIAGSGC